MGPCSSRGFTMRLMEEKADERHPDCLISSSAVLSANARGHHPGAVVQF